MKYTDDEHLLMSLVECNNPFGRIIRNPVQKTVNMLKRLNSLGLLKVELCEVRIRISQKGRTAVKRLIKS